MATSQPTDPAFPHVAPEYRVFTNDDLHELFAAELPVFFDTNSIRRIWTLHTLPRRSILALIEALRGRLFLPYQTQTELYRQAHSGALSSVPAFGLVDAIGRIASIKKATIEEIAKVRPLEVAGATVAEDEVGSLRESVEAKFGEFADWHRDVQTQIRGWLGEPVDVKGVRRGEIPNPLLEEIAEVFGRERLLGKPDEAVRERWLAEYKERTSLDDPVGPGASDTPKASPESAAGDYIMWQEAIAHCKEFGASEGFFFVTEEKKKDYWEAQQDAKALRRLDPRIQRDTIDSTGGPMLIIDFEQFARLASPDEQSLDSKYSQIVRDTETVIEPWSREAYQLLLTTLEDLGADRQRRVILRAAELGGYTTRDQIGEVLGWNGENRHLTRFRMPADRVKRELMSVGLLAESSQDPLVAAYGGPGEAVGYSVPSEFSDYYDAFQQPGEAD